MHSAYLQLVPARPRAEAPLLVLRPPCPGCGRHRLRTPAPSLARSAAHLPAQRASLGRPRPLAGEAEACTLRHCPGSDRGSPLHEGWATHP
ncbi:hypothetical protein NDU88_001155 [Pleurodeles waltl]|uniref:Uncharacterized protein n=1 Tax=Pleurodeles waltl TaxID=8319 RepID=A0AAV7U641_PLEWA|nr:hypothetical protein NDU88_001155 [Pleurodeles waltl]